MPEVTIIAKPAPFFGPKQHGTTHFLGVKREPQARRGPESASVRPSVCGRPPVVGLSARACPFSGCKIGPHGQTAFAGLSRSEAAWHDGILPPEKAPPDQPLHTRCVFTSWVGLRRATPHLKVPQAPLKKAAGWRVWDFSQKIGSPDPPPT